MVLDAGGILAEQVVLYQLLDRGADGLRASLHDRLAPADEAVARFEAEEQPARGHRVQLVFADLGHGASDGLSGCVSALPAGSTVLERTTIGDIQSRRSTRA